MSGSISSASANAYSGLQAADTQLAVAATNIANSGDTGALPDASPFGGSAVAAPPLTGTQPSNAASQVFQALQSTQTPAVGGGVNASVSRSSEYSVSYQPSSPNADAQGLVATPNTNPVQQAVQLITASTSAAANVQTAKVSNDITKRVLDLTT